MIKKISSNCTFGFKFFTAPFIATFPLIFLLLTAESKIKALFVGLLSTLITYPLWGPLAKLKSLSIKDNQLIVSNFKKKIMININNIEKIEIGFLTTKIYFKTITQFGYKIIFRLPYNWFDFNEDPNIVELKKRIGRDITND